MGRREGKRKGGIKIEKKGIKRKMRGKNKNGKSGKNIVTENRHKRKKEYRQGDMDEPSKKTQPLTVT